VTARIAALVLVLLALLAGSAWLLLPRARTEAEDPGTPMPMAGPGYLPPGAPVDPPPAPPPHPGHTAVDFALLAGFDYDPEADVVPEEVRELDGRLVELRGVLYYGIPDPERVTEFYLMPNHLICCFGTPRPNDTVAVTLREGLVIRYSLAFQLVRGRLRVEPLRDEAGNLLALYAIDDAQAEALQ